MARFEFNLQAVLEQRRNEEDAAQRDLAKLLREKMVLDRELKGMQDSISGDKRAMADALVGRVNVPRIRQHASHQAQVTIRAQQFVVRMLGLERRIDESRSSLLEASKRRKAIERLRARRFQKWKAEQDRIERIELDEIGSQLHYRQTFRQPA